VTEVVVSSQGEPSRPAPALKSDPNPPNTRLGTIQAVALIMGSISGHSFWVYWALFFSGSWRAPARYPCVHGATGPDDQAHTCPALPTKGPR